MKRSGGGGVEQRSRPGAVSRGPNLAARRNPYPARPFSIAARWPDGLRVTYYFGASDRRNDYAALLRQWGCYVRTLDARAA